MSCHAGIKTHRVHIYRVLGDGMGRPNWAKYAAFRSATIAGMLHIEIPHISHWCVRSKIYINPRLGFEYLVIQFTEFYYLKVTVAGLLETLLTASNETCRGRQTQLWLQGFVWWPGQPATFSHEPIFRPIFRVTTTSVHIVTRYQLQSSWVQFPVRFGN